MQITTIGLDIAKNVFQVHGIDAAKKVVVRKRLRRSQVLKFFASLPLCLVGMEACASAHYWARELTKRPTPKRAARRFAGPPCDLWGRSRPSSRAG
jgi:transposase